VPTRLGEAIGQGSAKPAFMQNEFWDWAVFFVAKDESLEQKPMAAVKPASLHGAKACKECMDGQQARLAMPPHVSEAETALVENSLKTSSVFFLGGPGRIRQNEATRKHL